MNKIGEIVTEYFSVIDENTMNLLSSIDLDDFSSTIFNPNGDEVSSEVSVSFKNLGFGHYSVSFTPNMKGNWMLNVYHSIHFPWGKSTSVYVEETDIGTLTEMMKRILGLTQENFFIDQTNYDQEGNLVSSRIRIYENSVNVGTNNGIIATYQAEAGYNNGLLQAYRVRKL